MNKFLYRIIFNKTRGMLMVVADIARSGRASNPRRERSKKSAIRQLSITPLRFALYLTAGLVSLPLHAGIRADHHSPDNQQPTIHATASGLPQIDIQTPNAHGVSRNQYSQFDVDSRGAILNNSHNATRTQLAGQITGNPWLAKQEARIILNEVNSRNLSKLNGFIEVAGRRAEVIITNPYGITCNGCGFINAEQAMLVAGQARMEGGKLKGFDVDGGRINITGKGLNAHDADYTRLIARAVNINARVQTKGNLKVTTGRNETDANGRVTRVKPQDEDNRPDFALDVAVLGGMYANKIMLEGTEFGVGVRNAGELGAMAGELSLSVNGQLINSGLLSGQKDLQLAVKGDMHHTGSLTAGGDLKLSVPGTLHNEGMIRGGKDVRLTAAVIESTRQGTLEAGSDSQGITGKQGNLLLTASGELKMQGQNLAVGNLQATGSRIDLADSQTQGRTVTLKARQGEVRTANAVVRGRDSVKIQTHTLLDNRGGKVAGGTLNLQAPEINNTGGLLHQERAQNLVLKSDVILNHQGKLINAGSTHLQAVRIENQAGVLAANGHNLTLDTHFLDNRQGTVQLVGHGQLQLSADELQSHNGKILSAGKLSLSSRSIDLSAAQTQAQQITLTADSLNNDNGTLLAPGSGGITLNVADQLSNRHGRIKSGGNLAIRSGALDSQAGRIIADGYAALHTSLLSNADGHIIGSQGLDITSHALNNHRGRLQSTGGMILNTQGEALTNQLGTLSSDGQISITSSRLDNQQGTVEGGSALSINTLDTVDNSNGQLMSKGLFTLTAAKLDNRQGITQTADGQLILQDKLDNTAGQILAGGTLLLNSRQVINRNTFQPGKGLEAKALTITTDKLDNTKGALCAADSLTATVQQILENRHGLISSQGSLQVEGNKLAVHNHQGSLIAARDARLTTSSLGGDGKIQSQGALDIWLKQDFHNTDTVNASGELTLVTDGKMVNSGILTGQQHLDLDASTIINTADGHISAQEAHLTARKTLNNIGLIDGGLTHLQAGTLSNTGTGRIFGGHVTIAADVLNNLKHRSKTAVIAARERLDIGARTINNRDHALITSQGDIAFGATLDTMFQATGQGQTLNNHGALVDAGRHLIIDMKKVSNINRNLVTQTVLVEKSPYHEAVLRGHNTRYNWEQVDTSYRNKYKVHDAIMPDGSRNNEFYEYSYLRTVNETQVKSSEPGKILARKNLTFNTEHLVNYDSQIIAGGKLGGNTGTLDNHATKGERITTDKGWQTYWYAKKKKRKRGGTDTSQGRDGSHYRPAPVIQTLDLKTLAWQGNTVPQSDNIDIGTRQIPGVRLEPSELFKGHSLLPPAGQTYTLTLPPEVINGQTITPFVCTVSPNIQLPDSSLFSLHPGTDSQYLVETDPRFIDKKLWLTSDYMQKAFTTHHDNTHKRLGDGYYEQQLIRDQLIQLTSQRYTRNHAEDEAQYQALMKSGIAFGKQYQLQPGVALTPAQMALLTTDIVWLADRNVRLADGSIQRVRIPQVYAKLKENDLNGDGALLGGKDVALSARGTIRNSGSISSLDATHLMAQNLINSGAISSNSITLQAKENIDNIGGQIRGGDTVSLLAGQNIDSQTTTRTDGTRRWADRQAGIYVNQADGRLTLNALNNITLSGSTTENSGQDGSTLLQAGNDLRLETVNTLQTEISDFDNDNWRHLTQQTDTGSRIATQGALTLSAGRDITATAADVSTDAALVAQAQRDIRLNAGHTTIHLSEHSKQSSSGMLSSMSIETHDEVHEHQPINSTLYGDTIDMQSGRNLLVSGSNAVSTQDINLNAGHDLSVTAATGSREETHLRQEKKSGLMGSGGIGFTVGKASQKTTTDQNDNLNYGSVVGSNKGHVILKAGNQATVHGSDLVAGKNMALSGNNVNITAAENSHTSLTQMEQKQSGLTIALSGTVGSALNTAASTLQHAKKEDDSRLSALQNTKAALSGIQAGQAYGYDNAQTEAANAKNADAGLKEGDEGAAKGATNTIGISASYGSQSSKSETHTESRQALGSKIVARENLTIMAGGQHAGIPSGDIAITGSMLKAGQDLSLDATRDINLHSALNTESTTSKNSSKGGNIGIGIGVGSGGYGISVSAGINAGKGHEDGNGLTHTNATLDSGSRLSLTSGRDTTLKGAQGRGEKITTHMGRNLTLQSQQDSNCYDAGQQDFSAGGSFTFGSMTGSGYLSVTQDKLNSNFDSVKEQTGLFAVKGGYDVKVREHTRLDGAVLDSRAEADKNHLDTGTLNWSDIHNQADFSVEHIGVSLSSGGPVGKDLLTNMAGSLLSGGNKSDHAEGSTRAGVSEGSLIIRNTKRQQRDIAQLNRDTSHANEGSISPIFNREKEQKRLRQAHLVSEIGLQALDIYHTHEATKATQTATALLSDSKKWQALQNHAQQTLDQEHRKNPLVDNGPQAVKDRAWQQAYDTALTQQGAQMGGSVRTAVHAVVGSLQALAGGDIKAALAQGAAPYLAAQVKDVTTGGKPYSELSQQEKLNNVLAHALLGGIVAELSYGNAAAGATGAATAELTTPAISLALYGTADSDKLTSHQKENLSLLTTLASGIAAGVSNHSTAGAVTGAQAGKNAVENNFLSVPEKTELELAKQKLQNSKDPAEREQAQQKINALKELDISRDKKVIEACSNGGAGSAACASARLEVVAAKVEYETGPYNSKISQQYADAYGQIVNLLNITSVDVQNQQQVKDAMVNYAMVQLGVDKPTAEAYIETYDGMKIVAASVTPILGTAAANKLSSLTNKVVPPENSQSAQTVKSYGPHESGPLGNPNDQRAPASTFRSGAYTEKIAETDIYLYRDYGGSAKVDGRYWTPEPSKGPLQSQLDSAVLPEWGNTFKNQSVIKIPKGTTYYEGTAAAQTGTKGTNPTLHGGGTQIFLPTPKNDWIIKK